MTWDVRRLCKEMLKRPFSKKKVPGYVPLLDACDIIGNVMRLTIRCLYVSC